MTSRDKAHDTGNTARRDARPDTKAATRHDTEDSGLLTRRVAASRRDNATDSYTSGPYRLTGLSPDQLRALPAAVPFDPIVPAAFGISRSAAYRALAAGQLPIKPLRLGRRLIVRRSDLLTALGLSDEPGNPQNDPLHGGPNQRKDSQ
jgi:hypothetical protein